MSPLIFFRNLQRVPANDSGGADFARSNVHPAFRNLIETTFAAAILFAATAGCAVGPDYQKPKTQTPEQFSDTGPWKEATPRDQLPKGEWWKIFHDPSLDLLEGQAAQASPTLQAALARLQQSQAIARVSLSDFFPFASVDPTASRTRYSGERQTQTPATRQAYITNSFDLPLDLSYEIDFFGRVRRSVESARALEESSEAAYETSKLSLQSDVAQTYFAVRELQTEARILDQNIETRRQALDLVQRRYQGGASGELDVRRAETEWATAQADRAAINKRRNELTHALAVLVGQTPSTFVFAEGGLPTEFPILPVGLPSELLERRPDVAQAERNLASANALIGVAKAAFFPSIRLIGSAGFNSTELSSLLNWNSREWSIGPRLSLPIFQGGRNRANLDRAKSSYEESVAIYRQRVLVAFQDVEDGLSGLRLLAEQGDALQRAATSARAAANLSTIRYKAGLVSYLEVVDSERTALQAERSALQIRAQRLSTTVFMVKALGGGWSPSQ